MFVNNYIFSNSSLDILPSSNSPFKKRKIYYETTIKKKIKDNLSIFNNSNLLINAVRNFSVKYELEDKKIFSDYKFVISFEDLINLIRYCLDSQKTLHEFEIEETNKINSFTQNFIKNISNYINSYEKVEKVNPMPKNSYKNKYTLNNANIDFNTHKVNNRKSSSIIKSSSCWIDLAKTKMKLPKYKQNITKNFQTNLKNNKNSNNGKLNICTKPNKIKKEENLNDEQNYTNTYFKRRKYKNSLNLFSPTNNPKNKENSIKVTKNHLNKSIRRRRNNRGYFTELNNNIGSTNKSNLNKSAEKRKTFGSYINDGKPMSIFTACEFLRSSSFVLKNKNKIADDNNEKNINYNSNRTKKEIRLDDDKNVWYYNGKAPRPSNFTSKLLEKGIKFIDDFNGLKEEEKKKKNY